jgi:hypothetical protein
VLFREARSNAQRPWQCLIERVVFTQRLFERFDSSGAQIVEIRAANRRNSVAQKRERGRCTPATAEDQKREST